MFLSSSRRRHTRLQGDWSPDVCSSDLKLKEERTRLDEKLRTTTTEIFGEELSVEQLDAKLGPSKEKSPLPKLTARSEERRVGKETRSALSTSHETNHTGKPSRKSRDNL